MFKKLVATTVVMSGLLGNLKAQNTAGLEKSVNNLATTGAHIQQDVQRSNEQTRLMLAMMLAMRATMSPAQTKAFDATLNTYGYIYEEGILYRQVLSTKQGRRDIDREKSTKDPVTGKWNVVYKDGSSAELVRVPILTPSPILNVADMPLER